MLPYYKIPADWYNIPDVTTRTKSNVSLIEHNRTQSNRGWGKFHKFVTSWIETMEMSPGLSNFSKPYCARGLDTLVDELLMFMACLC